MQAASIKLTDEKLLQLKLVSNDYLGSGYDVCGEYGSAASIKRKIFDLSKVPDELKREIANPSTDFFSVSGKTYQELQTSLTAKVNLSTNYLLFSGSIESSYSETALSISESSFVSIKLFMRYVTWKLQTFSQEYMYPQVIEDFKTKDGLWLIEQYGAAVVMGLDVGGQWSDNFTVSKLYENSTSSVSVAMEAAYEGVVSGGGSVEISDAVKKEKSIASRQVHVVGGKPKYAPSKLEKWQESVEDNPAFMNFTPDGLVWMWDLFPEQKKKLQDALKIYVEKRQLKIEEKHLIECEIVDSYQYTNDADSGADKDLALYKPSTSQAYKYVGVNGNENKSLIVKQRSTKYGAITEPQGWQRVWNDRGSWNGNDYSCWIPKAPPGFVTLGIYCRFRVDSQDPPSKEEAEGLVVVHKSLVKEANLAVKDVWSDDGIGSDYQLKFGRLPHHALWPSLTTDPEAGALPTMYTFKDEYMVKPSS